MRSHPRHIPLSHPGSHPSIKSQRRPSSRGGLSRPRQPRLLIGLRHIPLGHIPLFTYRSHASPGGVPGCRAPLAQLPPSRPRHVPVTTQSSPVTPQSRPSHVPVTFQSRPSHVPVTSFLSRPLLLPRSLPSSPYFSPALPPSPSSLSSLPLPLPSLPSLPLSRPVPVPVPPLPLLACRASRDGFRNEL